MKHVDHQIQAYCDDELAPSLRAAFESHVRECAVCRGELEAARQLWAQVDTAAGALPSPEIWSGVAAQIGERGRRSPWTWTQRGLAVAATLAGVAIGFGLGGGDAAVQGDPDTTTASTEYLEESLPSLDQLWLQLGDSDEDAGS